MLNRYAEIAYSDGMCHISHSGRFGISGFVFLTKSSQYRLERIIKKYKFKKFSEYGYIDKYEFIPYLEQIEELKKHIEELETNLRNVSDIINDCD